MTLSLVTSVYFDFLYLNFRVIIPNCTHPKRCGENNKDDVWLVRIHGGILFFLYSFDFYLMKKQKDQYQTSFFLGGMYHSNDRFTGEKKL